MLCARRVRVVRQRRVRVFFGRFPREYLARPASLHGNTRFCLFLVVIVSGHRYVYSLPRYSTSYHLGSHLYLRFVRAGRLVRRHVRVAYSRLAVVQALLFFFPSGNVSSLYGLQVLTSVRRVYQSTCRFGNLVFLYSPITVRFLRSVISVRVWGFPKVPRRTVASHYV